MVGKFCILSNFWRSFHSFARCFLWNNFAQKIIVKLRRQIRLYLTFSSHNFQSVMSLLCCWSLYLLHIWSFAFGGGVCVCERIIIVSPNSTSSNEPRDSHNPKIWSKFKSISGITNPFSWSSSTRSLGLNKHSSAFTHLRQVIDNSPTSPWLMSWNSLCQQMDRFSCFMNGKWSCTRF